MMSKAALILSLRLQSLHFLEQNGRFHINAIINVMQHVYISKQISF